MLILLLAAFVANAGPSPKPAVLASARASVRILQPARASKLDWNRAIHRTERVIVDEQGRRLTLRTIDFE